LGPYYISVADYNISFPFFFCKAGWFQCNREQMISLVGTYKMDMGNGIFRTYSELVIALSISFTLICLFGALLNWFLKRKQIRA
jgi:hypothetical protein